MANKSPIQWKRWNLDYTKRVMAADAESAMAQALLGCWPTRIQKALLKRYTNRDSLSRTEK